MCLKPTSARGWAVSVRTTSHRGPYSPVPFTSTLLVIPRHTHFGPRCAYGGHDCAMCTQCRGRPS